MFTYTGILKIKNPEVKISDRFKKREFVLTEQTSSPYPQTVLFQLTQERCNLIDDVNIGDEITVHFYLRGREWKNPQGEIKFFNSLEVFKIEKKSSSNMEAENAQETIPEKASEAANFNNETLVPTPDDILPF
jgi:hypothetical protein